MPVKGYEYSNTNDGKRNEVVVDTEGKIKIGKTTSASIST